MSRIAVIGLVGQSVFLPVREFHKGGETLEAEGIHFELGGKGFNQAVAAARYGASVAFLGAAGDDFIDSIRGFLSDNGVEPHIVRKEGNSSFAAIITDASGRNRVTEYVGAELCESDVADFAETLRNSDVLLLSNEVPEDVNLAAARIARASGVRVILNPAPQRRISPELVKLVELFTPNEHEREGLETLSNVIVTLGSEGCLYCESGERIAAAKVTAVDTTGAGDTFNGVLAACLGSGLSVRESIRNAGAAATLSVTKRYAVSSIPTKKEIDEFMGERR